MFQIIIKQIKVCYDSSKPATMSKQHCRIQQVERFFRQSRNKSNVFSLFRLCRKNHSICSIRQCCFDIVAGVDGALGVVHEKLTQEIMNMLAP